MLSISNLLNIELYQISQISGMLYINGATKYILQVLNTYVTMFNLYQ